ncbi:MAG: replication initiator protein [Microviridae sp.]|nr:MAG: replication initiator protein [Microviridae sp.]
MACYYPTPAAHDPITGTIELWPPVGSANIYLPCGGCLGCKTDRALEWARRATHEASCWTHNSFLTLTYREAPAELQPEDLQGFIKRLRSAHHRQHLAISREPGQLRYLGCGEYGDRNGRPHFHLCLFNCGLNDAYRVGSELTESPLINQLWPHGIHRIGQLEAASANYVAQYTIKKIGATDCDADGVVRQAPFLRASLKPAIGATWLKKFQRDVTNGFLVFNGTPGPVPRYYRKYLAKHNPQLAEASRHAALALRELTKQRSGSAGHADPSDLSRTEQSEKHDRSIVLQQRQATADEQQARRTAGEIIHHSRNTHLHDRRL